ncbi:Uncharacterised protein [Candidatus Norongarragalina meridionalis]|nr:Uncharacterised protein [Candidatus Norongarragalina meridionalis]
MVHPLLIRQFEELEATKTRRLFPKLIGAYDKPLTEETGILGVNRRGGRYAILFRKSLGFDLINRLRTSEEYRVVESNRGLLGSKTVDRLSTTKPSGTTKEFQIFDPKDVKKLQSAIKARTDFLQHFRLQLNEKQFDLRLYSKDPRHRDKVVKIKADIADLTQKIRKNEKRKASLERQLAETKPLLKVLVKGHVISFKGDWRNALAILDGPLRL